MNTEETKAVVQTLVSQSLADHLGDVRDAEEDLWKLLGAAPLANDHPAYYSDNPFTIARARLIAAGLSSAMPEYALQVDDEAGQQ